MSCDALNAQAQCLYSSTAGKKNCSESESTDIVTLWHYYYSCCVVITIELELKHVLLYLSSLV